MKNSVLTAFMLFVFAGTAGASSVQIEGGVVAASNAMHNTVKRAVATPDFSRCTPITMLYDSTSKAGSPVSVQAGQNGSDLRSFDYILGQGGQECSNSSEYDAYASKDELTPSPVPLPAAGWLFGSALVGFVAMSSRRRI